MRLEDVREDGDMVAMGYKCKGKLVDNPVLEERGVFERLWLWERGGERVVTLDKGNSYCEVVPMEIAYNPELYNEWVMRGLSPEQRFDVMNPWDGCFNA